MYAIYRYSEHKNVKQIGICKVRGQEVYRMENPMPVIMVPRKQNISVWVSDLKDIPTTRSMAFEFRPLPRFKVSTKKTVYTSESFDFVPVSIAKKFSNGSAPGEDEYDKFDRIKIVIKYELTQIDETYERIYRCDEWEKMALELSR